MCARQSLLTIVGEYAEDYETMAPFRALQMVDTPSTPYVGSGLAGARGLAG